MAVAITAAVLVFVFSTSLLFHRYVSVQEPAGSVRVIGSEALDGATVTLQDKQSLRPPLEAELTQRSHFRIRFLADPGTYNLHVTTATGDVVFSHRLDIYARHPATVDLSPLLPQTRPHDQ